MHRIGLYQKQFFWFTQASRDITRNFITEYIWQKIYTLIFYQELLHVLSLIVYACFKSKYTFQIKQTKQIFH